MRSDGVGIETADEDIVATAWREPAPEAAFLREHVVADLDHWRPSSSLDG